MPNTYECVLWGTPNPSKIGLIWYSFVIMLPITKLLLSYVNGRSCRISLLLDQYIMGEIENEIYCFCIFLENFCAFCDSSSHLFWNLSAFLTFDELISNYCSWQFLGNPQDETRDLLPYWYNLLSSNPNSHNYDIPRQDQSDAGTMVLHKHRLSSFYQDVCIFCSTKVRYILHICSVRVYHWHLFQHRWEDSP